MADAGALHDDVHRIVVCRVEAGGTPGWVATAYGYGGVYLASEVSDDASTAWRRLMEIAT